MHKDAAVIQWWAEGKDFNGQDPADYWDGLLLEEEREAIRQEYAKAIAD